MPIRRKRLAPPPQSDEGPGTGTAILGAVALLGAGLLARKPGLIGKAGSALMNARYASMLSGLATPKSLIGGAGAPFIASMESGSMAPIKAFFKPETVKAFGRNLRSGRSLGPVAGGGEETAGQVASRWNPFGRIIGAGDVTARERMIAGGVNAKEAERLMLQTPLDPGIAGALDNPIAKVAVPFRRTPINFFKEGMRSYAPLGKVISRQKLDPTEYRKLKTLGVISGAGAATGVATEEGEGFQQAIPLGLGTAAAGVYGLPFAAGAAIGRKYLGSGKNRSAGTAMQGTVPFSEYGLTSTITDPLRALRPGEQAGIKLIKRIRGAR